MSDLPPREHICRAREAVAVGTALADRPPRRSGRAAFPHPAPRSGLRGTCGAVCHSAYGTRLSGPVSGVWKRSNGIALAPPPSLHSLHPSDCRLFGNFIGTTQRSDCLGAFIVGVRSHPSRRVRCWTAPPLWIAPWPIHPGSPDWEYMMRLCMLRSPTPPSSYHSCQSEWQDVAFRALGPRRHSKVARLFRGSILGLHIPCQRFTGVVTTASA